MSTGIEAHSHSSLPTIPLYSICTRPFGGFGLSQCNLYLFAHSSIAFAAGYELDPKSGTRVSLVQNTAAGRSIWASSSVTPNRNSDPWSVSDISAHPNGREVGIVLSVTHDASSEVLAHVQDHIPQLGHLLVFTISPDIGPMAVKDGDHAWGLAQELVKTVRERRPRHTPTGPLHIFSAAPNGLVFLVGRLARSLGPIQLYEHDFESNWPSRSESEYCLTGAAGKPRSLGVNHSCRSSMVSHRCLLNPVTFSTGLGTLGACG